MKVSENTGNGRLKAMSAIIIVAPFILVLLCAGALISPATRSAALWVLRENHPVELLTFIVATSGGILGLAVAWQAKKQGERTFVFGFFTLFAMVLLFVGMEEIAWGQQFFGFASPDTWSSINAQGETTLHNLVGIQGRSEIFRLLFGLAGLAGVLFCYSPLFKKIGAPMLLLPWAIIIAAHAGVDVYNDFFPISARFDFYTQRTSELVEMLIAISSAIYLGLKAKTFSPHAKGSHVESDINLGVRNWRH